MVGMTPVATTIARLLLVLSVILPGTSPFLVHHPPRTQEQQQHPMLLLRCALIGGSSRISIFPGSRVLPPSLAYRQERTVLSAAATTVAAKQKKSRGRPSSAKSVGTASKSSSTSSAVGTSESGGGGTAAAGGKLIIVESATKAKTIRKYLPDGWDVDYCMGHVRELPRSMSDIPPGSREKFKVLGVRVDQEFEPVWVVLPGKEQVVNRLKVKAKGCSELYLATDEDREGEAISWHLLELLKPTVPTQRVVFHEITPSAVKAGIEAPRAIDTNLVEAQHARRILDRVAGYTMSPLLWKKITTRLSAGRVQSAGLKLLVDRERERMVFKSAAYAGLRASVRGASWQSDVEARLQAVNGHRLAVGTDFDPRTGELAEKKAGQGVVWVKEAEMEEIRAKLEKPHTQWTVKTVESKVISRKRPAPFTTSTMQQEANSKLGLTSAQTMKIAQELYEEGFISYMRTDSPNMGREATLVARQQALELYGPQDAQGGSDKKNAATASAQEAHEAIRPSIVNDRFVPPKDTGIADKKKLDLYQLIYERALASVMKDAKLERKIVGVQAVSGDEEAVSADFQMSGQTVLVHGFLRALRDSSTPTSSTAGGEGGEEGEGADVIQQGLQDLKPGQSLMCTSLKTQPKTTAPPYRYTQGSFVRMVEELGIGRPSTYSTIIEVLKTRAYFTMKAGGHMVPTLVGFVVIQLLERHFPDFVDASFTSKMEATLDAIAKGSVDRTMYLGEYFLGLTSAIDLVTDTIDRNYAKRVVLATVGHAPCGVFIGPYGAYVRDLLAGEPTDADLLNNDGAARKYYQDLWSNNDAEFSEAVGKVRRTQVPPDLCNDPANITGDDLLALLDMSVQGKVLGTDPRTGAELVVRTVSKYGKVIEMKEQAAAQQPPPPGSSSDSSSSSSEAEAAGVIKKVQVPSNLDVSECSVETALRLLTTFPKTLGTHPETGQDMVVNMGYYPNLRMGNFSYGLLNHTVQEILELNKEDGIRLIKEGKATYYLGDYQGAGMWFVPKGRYSYPHIRWNQMKVYLKENQLEADGRPTTETALAVLRTRAGGKAGGKKGKGASSRAAAAAEPPAAPIKKKKQSRSPSAFLLFSKEARPTLPPGMKFGEQQVALAAQWKAMEGSEQRGAYEAKAKDAAAAQADSDAAGAGAEGLSKERRKASTKAGGGGNVFTFFVKENRAELPPGLTAAAIMKEMALKWRELGDKERGEVRERFLAASSAGGSAVAAVSSQ